MKYDGATRSALLMTKRLRQGAVTAATAAEATKAPRAAIRQTIATQRLSGSIFVIAKSSSPVALSPER